MPADTLLLYSELAGWWPLLSAPAEYAEEAEVYRRVLLGANPAVRSVLELGSGGGNNASHLKKHFEMTLVDLSAEMIAISRRLNPDLPHHHGDMRSARLGRTFDAVFIHDAVMYITTRDGLLQAMQTAAAHLNPGGVVLLVPDWVRETYRDLTDHGGHDGEEVTAEYGDEYLGRGLRYLEWVYDPDPTDDTYVTAFSYLVREGDTIRCLSERHVDGIFPRQVWLDLLDQAGFDAHTQPLVLSDLAEGMTEMFIGIKRA